MKPPSTPRAMKFRFSDSRTLGAREVNRVRGSVRLTCVSSPFSLVPPRVDTKKEVKK